MEVESYGSSRRGLAGKKGGEMTRFLRVLLGSPAFLACAILACSKTLETQVVDYESGIALARRDPGCDLVLHERGQPVPSGCVPVGDVFVGDTGSSIDCGYDRVQREMRDAACSFGADAVQIVGHQKPSFFGSSCHQIRAQFLRCSQDGGGR